MGSKRSLLLLLCLVVVGCEGHEGPGANASFSIDTLPGGAVRVSNAEHGEWSPDTEWSLVEDLRIGSADGSGPEAFGSVHALEVDAYGRIYVLDRLAHQVQVFGPNGEHLRTLGSEGAGPGEMSQPSGLAWMPGWHLWVEDRGNSRFAVFDTTGALVDTHPRDFPWMEFRWRGGFDREGHRYGLGSELRGRRSHDVLLRLDGRGAQVGTIELPRFEEARFEVTSNDAPLAAARVPFSPHLHWHLTPDGALWFGTTDEYRLTQRSLDGDTIRIVERDAPPTPITAAEREEALAEDYLAPFREAGVVDPAMVPENHPYWAGFTVSSDGFLWVIPRMPDGGAAAFDVFDPEGVYLGRIPVDEPGLQSGPAPVVRGDRLYAVVRDDLGVPYVVRMRVLSSTPGPVASQKPDSPGGYDLHLGTWTPNVALGEDSPYVAPPPRTRLAKERGD